jgi:hypothetical protein
MKKQYCNRYEIFCRYQRFYLFFNSEVSLEKTHNDPSDRLIISQAITEKIPVISSDTAFPLYRKHGLDLIEN